MRKTKQKWAGVLVGLTAVGLATPLVAQTTLENNPKGILDEAWQIINTNYVDPGFNRVNWQQVRRDLLSREYSSPAQAYAALRAEVNKLADPYTRFLDPQEFQALVNQTSGEFSGVGVRLKLEEEQEEKRLIIADVVENSPAAKAGIRPGDELVSVAGRAAKGMTLEDASKLIRGPVGSVLRLEVRRAKETLPLQITRAWIETKIVDYALKREQGRVIGLIRLQGFNAHATEQMREAIQSLQRQGAQAYVLDLRGNPGGLLSSSIEITRMWLNQGRIVSTVGRQGEREVFNANGTAFARGPLAILVDHQSASASEIVAGALQDHKRAVVVGSPTFGKALVQSVHRLSDGAGLAVTIAHYYTPSGRDIARKGINPNVTVAVSRAQRQALAQRPADTSIGRDPAYARAVELLTKTTAGTAPKTPSSQSRTPQSPQRNPG
ncbi:carboxyl-terminal protease [Gloeomargarita lithophora Alchichica-D10]|uniref:Carboxyl-terminal protease n=1 Tax=Gloeomargarita lithophora Alchichica-D10 TaxID=1188229 RepID=A0A1J0A8X3_9CYAN|nr:S41 family peptidase [Gloeomargarita lithophora]APB32386.1 carboxyl-terminal protease [Gloeomargarita lithophora Alchichica-D10]